MRRSTLTAVCSLGLLCLALMATHSAAAQSTWSAPFDVAEAAHFSWFPDLAVDAEGGVHVIWASGDAGPADSENPPETTDLLRYRVLRAGAWSAVNDILFTGTGGYTVRNSVVAGRDGRLHVLVRMHTQVYATSAPWDEAWSARSWSAPVLLSGEVAYYTALAADSTNTLHALWSEAVQGQDTQSVCLNCSDLFYRRSSDGGQTWSEPRNLSSTVEGENRPQLRVDGHDRLHAVWDLGVDWYAGAGTPKAGVYRRSDDSGQTWTAPMIFTAGGRPVQQTSLAVTGEGNPFVVFRDTESDRIYFQYSRDGGNTWGPLGEIPGVKARNIADNNLDTYALAVDSNGRVHLLMVGFRTADLFDASNPWLLHLVWNGEQWSQPLVVMGADLYPEWPRITITNGNQIHAVWFTRHADELFGSENGAYYQVWYSTLTTDASAVASLPAFTPVPTAQPSPTPQPTVMPTPTPLPQVSQQAPQLSGGPAWELRGLRTIFIALLPAGAIVALVVTVARRRRG
ncbi:MAG: glycosyl hydrolase [Chloroflexales bacterium]|nr:glycosyl hydrolase [Chloroflexales bacterium]